MDEEARAWDTYLLYPPALRAAMFSIHRSLELAGMRPASSSLCFVRIRGPPPPIASGFIASSDAPSSSFSLQS